jgi:hypothetical protein
VSLTEIKSGKNNIGKRNIVFFRQKRMFDKNEKIIFGVYAFFYIRGQKNNDENFLFFIQ